MNKEKLKVQKRLNMCSVSMMESMLRNRNQRNIKEKKEI